MSLFDSYPFGTREKWSNITRETYTTNTSNSDNTTRRSGQSFDDSFFKDSNEYFKRFFDRKIELKPSFIASNSTQHSFNSKNKFVIRINVREFSFDDIEVKIKDENLIIKCKHNEKRDENNGWITRDITRRYELPSDVDIDSVKSTLNELNGILTVEINKLDANHVKIPVIHEKSSTNTDNKFIHKPIIQTINSIDSEHMTTTKSLRERKNSDNNFEIIDSFDSKNGFEVSL